MLNFIDRLELKRGYCWCFYLVKERKMWVYYLLKRRYFVKGGEGGGGIKRIYC